MQNSLKDSGQPKVAVVYHFFAHYRAAVLEELLQSPLHQYILVADTKDPDGHVREWAKPNTDDFVYAPCRRLGGRLFLQKGLIALALRNDISAIILLGNAAWPMTWLAAAAARLSGKKVLFWTHGWTRRDKGVRRIVRRVFYSLGHSLLLYGHRAKSIGVELGFSSSTLHVIYNSLDYEKQARLRQTLDRETLLQIRCEIFSNPNLPVAIYTGRLVQEKKIDQLLDAVGLLAAQGHLVNVLIVGDGPEREALVSQAASLKTEVHFEGACYDEERLARLLMTSNVSVAPDYVGLSVIHCLAYGTPILASDDPEANGPEWEAIQSGVSGTTFKRNSIPAMASTIRAWTEDSFPSEATRNSCFKLIEERYHPRVQRELIDRAVSGALAED